jgi:hypothetical protein
MERNLPLRDSISAHRRKALATRRVGVAATCACGENRPEALIPGSSPIICAACQRRASGRTTADNHHFAGKANSPITVTIPVNDHRARLSVAQADWPKATLGNVHGSPLLAAAASVRGFIDTLLYLIEQGLLFVADLLEQLDEYLLKELGPRWWRGTGIEQFAPKRKANGKP